MSHARELPLLIAFATVVRTGSFTAAARELGLSKSSVSEQVSALEQRCGVRLLERSTRSLRPTQVGERVLETAQAVVEAGRRLDTVLEEHRDAAVGTLRVATTNDLGPRVVAPIAARLVAEHARLKVEVVSDDSPRDLVQGGFDCAVRLGTPRTQGRVVIHLTQIQEAIVAAPSLAANWAHARRPRELKGAPWVHHSLLSGTEVMSFLGPRDTREEVVVTRRAQANTGEGVRALLLNGAGLGAIPDYLVADEVARGQLIRVCPEWIWRRISLFVELPSVKQKPQRLTLFVDALRRATADRTLFGAAAR